MKRKIIGYKAPFDMYRDKQIKKGDVFKKCHLDTYSCKGYVFPDEIVEPWEPVYEAEKLEIVDWKKEDNYTHAWIMFKGKLTQEIIDKIKEVINEKI